MAVMIFSRFLVFSAIIYVKIPWKISIRDKANFLPRKSSFKEMAQSNRTVLATAFFDGQPTRRPVQSFSRANIDGPETFLRQIHEDRKKREDGRQRAQAAVKIQSAWRQYKRCKDARQQLRDAFDTCVGQDITHHTIVANMRRLVFFFKPEVDGTRLVWLGQNFIKSKMAGDRYPHELLRFFLRKCLLYLKYVAPKGQSVSIAMPFRCLEVFLLDNRNDTNEDSWTRLVLLSDLIEHDYYGIMRDLFDYRTPSSDLISEQSKAPTIQAETFMMAITKPLAMEPALRLHPDKEAKIVAMKENAWHALIQHFLARSPMSPIVRFYVLPQLAKSMGNILACLEVAYRRGGGNRKSKLQEYNTPEFAFSLAYLAAKVNFESAGNEFISMYSKVCGSLAQLGLSHSPFDFDEEKDRMNQSATMEVDTEHIGCDWILTEWLKLNHDEPITQYLTRVFDTVQDGSDETMLTSLIELCRVHWGVEHVSRQQCRLLQMLAYQPKLIRRLWQTIRTCTTPSIMGPPRPLIEQLQKGSALSPEDRRQFIPLLSVFCALFSMALVAANDEDFFDDVNLKPHSSIVPFSRRTLASLSSILRDVALGLIELALPDSRPSISEPYRAALTSMGVDFSQQDTTEWNKLFDAVVRLLQLLHDRDERLQFCPVGYWSVKDSLVFAHLKMFRSTHQANSARRRRLFDVPRYLTRNELEEEKGFMLSAAERRDMTVLRKIPFVVPFEKRVELLYQLIMNDQAEHGRQPGLWQQGHLVNARRNFLYEDGFDQLSRENVPDLRQRIRVRLQNWAGAVEAGVDGGGLFREFLNELLKTAFDPQRGFYVATGHDSSLYPNPLAPVLFRDDEYRRHYYFLGRMVGKLIYENQLAELRFARFFLSRLLRPYDDVDVHHLSYYDPVLYKNVLRLKHEEDVSLLNLDFSVVVEELGEIQMSDLIPNGRNITVTNSNRLEYIQAIAEFYLHRRIRGQTDAFRSGLSDLIDIDWLQMFDYRELQVIISGADREVDVEDLRRHTTYYGDINMESGELNDDYVHQFWNVVRNFNDDQKRKLLKFVTSCSRPPLLGFRDLHPPFCLQVYNLRTGEQDRLPTAATCSNLLKLPRFPDEKTLREKLLYAIEAGSGFELS